MVFTKKDEEKRTAACFTWNTQAHAKKMVGMARLG